MHMNQNLQSPLKTDVCIVGAGPGGALLSYLLNQKESPRFSLRDNHTCTSRSAGSYSMWTAKRS